MGPSQLEFLSGMRSASAGQPLRVATYARIADGIQAGTFPLGSPLPRETELCAALGVSRTVVREALMLLEEDGLIVTRRGVGRFVTETLPEVGLEELRPFEQVLAAGGAPLDVHPGELELQTTTPFTTRLLGLVEGEDTRFRESTLTSDGRPVAILQEHLPEQGRLQQLVPSVAAALPKAARRGGSLLAALHELCGPVFASATCGVAVNVVGSTRSKLLGVKADAPVLILTQVAGTSTAPAYLAKCIVSAEVGHLRIMQSVPTR